MLAEATDRFDWSCWGYNLMINHFHLQIQNVGGTLSKGMHWLNSKFSKYINKKYDKVGHVFQGRFGDTLVQSGHHSNVLSRYIALNPVRKEWVKDPADWEWGSYAATLGLTAPHDCLDIDGALAEFGGNSPEGRLNYQEYVDAGINQPAPKNMYAPIIGDKQFIREQIGDTNNPHLLKLVRPSLSVVLAAANIEGRHRMTRRNLAVHDAVHFYLYKKNEVAEYLGVDKSTISKIFNFR
jgi:REP element-mobilizing transposase RayT